MAHAVADIIDQLSQIPPFPKVTAHLLKLLNDPGVSVQDLASVISADPSLVVKVLHLANSPFYMLSRPVQSVSDAVFVLGVSAIKTITTAVSIQQGMSNIRPRGDIFNLNDFWKHSYATAIGSNKLAKDEGLEDAEKLYLVGLIHDIGKIVQANNWPETYKAAVNRLRNENLRYEDVELELFSKSHVEISVILCRNWQFPDDVLAILDPNPAYPDESILTGNRIVMRANELATRSGFAFPQEELNADQSAGDDISTEMMEQLKVDVEYQLRILEL